ncbi:MAG: hypothetical protein KJ709_03225 [Nanoarchaeota archaeon]|nr:hypothetical protein [Nanoarchaeota archaeon]
MKLIRLLLLAALLSFMALPFVHAQKGHMTLLAVSNVDTVMSGSIADLYLEIKPGTGKVFIDTYPLTKIDTQLSTRYAKQIACKTLDKDCSRHDFFYTISSNSAIVGGPSAGSAIAVLTAAMLSNLEVDQEMSITGTINAGGLVGPVGGIKEKIDVAATHGLKTVLIPIGERNVEVLNKTVDMVEYGEEIGLEVIEISNLEEAMEMFTGESFVQEDKPLVINPQYEETMEELAKRLCERSEEIREKIRVVTNTTNFSFQYGSNLSEKGNEAYGTKSYYSAASYCFGANVRYRYVHIAGSPEEFSRIIASTQDSIQSAERKVDDRGYETLTDLQAFVVVKERLVEAQDYLDDAAEALEGNGTDAAGFSLAYAIERLYSAYAWSEFFGKGGKAFELDKETVKNSCTAKLEEADERYQYARLFFPRGLEDTRIGISRAKEEAQQGNYELCLFKASKAKAEADLLVSMLGIEEVKLGTLLSERIKIAQKSITKQQEMGVFPILGYSYFEYARSLEEEDPISAFLYSGYAIELSNLDMYLEQENSGLFLVPEKMLPFVYGVCIGLLLGIILMSGLIKRGGKR